MPVAGQPPGSSRTQSTPAVGAALSQPPLMDLHGDREHCMGRMEWMVRGDAALG